MVNPNLNYFKYINFKVFNLFRTHFTDIINKYRKDPHTPLYNNLFLSPSSSKRSFSVNGVAYPFVTLWPSDSFKYNEQFYGKSVLPRDFSYLEDNEEKILRGFLYDFKTNYDFTAGSYFRDFVDEVNLQLLELDRIRYFRIGLPEILPGLTTKLELEPLLQPVVYSPTDREFRIVTRYSLAITVPIFDNPKVLTNLSLYLQDVKIWGKF